MGPLRGSARMEQKDFFVRLAKKEKGIFYVFAGIFGRYDVKRQVGPPRPEFLEAPIYIPAAWDML
jgi:hypothetical protein